jgi:nitrogen regulatory protein P-II 1
VSDFMKRIIAVIRQEKFEDVKRALLAADVEGMNVSEVKGRGRQLGIKESYRGSSYCIDLIPKTRIELIVNDEEMENILQVIEESARTGEVGDGKIFVSDVMEVVRIRTGERGSDAV